MAERKRERDLQCIGTYIVACKFIKKNNYLDFSLIKFRIYKILFFSPKFHIIKRAFDIININMSIKYNI